MKGICMKKILIITASAGNNLELANMLSKEVESQNANFEVIELSGLDLPLYTTLAEKEGIPTEAHKVSSSLQAADAIIVLAPEYNGLIPPSLNNVIAWVSRTGEDWRSSFNNKVCAIGTHSGGGGAHVLIAMRQQLSFLGCNVLGREILTNFSKKLNPKTATAVINELLKLSNS
jgi:NAD(P)H-dependent FMN reductase